MTTDASALLPAGEVARTTPLQQAANGLRFATYGAVSWTDAEVRRIVECVPKGIAGALGNKAYYFVPLVMEPYRDEPPMIAAYSADAAERAICHRNVSGTGAASGEEHIFISARIMQDRFALAFELYINIGHGFVEAAAVAPAFAELAWAQAEQHVKGETSVDAYESRRKALADGRVDEKEKSEFLEASFSDAMAVYMLAMAVDVDYYELREREYPLLAPRALAERLRKVAEIFPSNEGYEFAVRYKRRG